MNPNITWEIVQANPDMPWNWRGLSANPNITPGIVQANLHKDWDWCKLSNNKFSKYKFPLPVMKRKAKEQSDKIRKELIEKVFAPHRVEKWIEYYGMDWDEKV